MAWWQPGTSIPNRIVFLQPEHRDDLRLELSYRPPPHPRVLEVSPSAGKWLPLVEVLGDIEDFEHAWRAQPTDGLILHQLVGNYDPSLRTLLTAMMDLLIAFRRYDVLSAVHHCQRLRAVVGAGSPLPSRAANWLGKTLTYLEHLAANCLSEFVLPGLYIHPHPVPQSKRWWRQPPSFKTTCQLAITKFDAVVNGGPPPSLLRIREWVVELQAVVGMLHVTHIGDPEAPRFRAASSFFTARSDAWYATDQTVLGLISLHRAAEWLLAAKCADQNLLDFTSYTVQFLQSAEAVTFNGLLDALAASGVNLQGLETPLRDLNAWRNLLAYTHHMSAPERAVARRLYETIRPQLRSLANNQWDAAVKVFGKPVPLDLMTLLDPDETLRKGFEELAPEILTL